MVVESEIFNVSQTLAQKEDDINSAPRSEVNRAGTPKHEIKAHGQDSADMEVRLMM